MADYDIADAFRRIELELIGSMKRNWEKHNLEEKETGFTWSRWQAEQLKGLEDFKKKNPKLFSSRFQAINENFLNTLLSQRETNFFGVNHDRMRALIKASTHDLVKAETAMLRTTNDAYRKVIYNAQVYMASGAGSLKQAIDMASDDFLTKGINCVVYKGGRRVNIATYAEMSLRTANKRVALYADGARRQEMGIHTVKVSKYGMCSKTCLPWQGRVYVDDVYSGGTAEEAKELNLPLLSTAIAGGLFHPNCKHQLSTYFPEMDEEDDDLKAPSEQVIYENPPGTQEHHYLLYQIQRERRLQIGSFDENKIQEHANKERKLVSLDEKWLKESERYENAIKEVGRDDILSNTWRPVVNSQYEKAVDLTELNLNGIKYIVDGKNVVLDYSVYEKRIGDILAKKYGKDVKMVPRINYPEGVSTPDYLVNGIKYDLKTPVGSGKHTLYNLLKKKKRQSSNFIFDVSECNLSDAEINSQVHYIFYSKSTNFVKTIVIYRDGYIVKAYKKS